MNMIKQWQDDFTAQPTLWYTYVRLHDCGCIEIQNYYDSKEAAMLEAKRYEYEIGSTHIHNMDLAKRRWVK